MPTCHGGEKSAAGGSGGASNALPESAGGLYGAEIQRVHDFFGDRIIENTEVGDEHFTELLSGAVAYIDPKDASTLYIRDRAALEKYISEHAGALHKNATVESVIAHEMAHALSTRLDESGILQRAIERYEKSGAYSEAVKTDAMLRYVPSWQVGAESISRTAVTSQHELFAEAVADVYRNGAGASELSKIIYDEMRRR